MQKKSNPYSWIYLIITLVLALIMVYLMLPYLQESDLNERPHNAQVWGTVSDWAMVIITLVTAYFLWKNLRTSYTPATGGRLSETLFQGIFIK